MVVVKKLFPLRRGPASFLWLLLLSGTLSLSAGDRSPAPVRQWMSQKPGEVIPLVQEDDFSCGYLALAAVYESYGLDPQVARLRERLGVSVPAIPFIDSSNGTLQPDLFRVLKQDGFESVVIDPNTESKLLERHLSGPHLALALVKTERAGGFHWIVLADYADGSYQIADSLVEGLQWKDGEELLGPRFLQALLLSPGVPDPDGPLGKVHYEGSVSLMDSLPLGLKIVAVGSFFVPLVVAYLLLRWLMRGRFFARRKGTA